MGNLSMLMGIVNITPDSFSDGGRFIAPEAAVDQCQMLIQQGADLIDLGAESTRPGAEPLSVTEEWSRLEPVLRRVLEKIPSSMISIDTYKPEIMLKAAQMGVGYINDVFGAEEISDDQLRMLARDFPHLKYIGMHSGGRPSNMQVDPLKSAGLVELLKAYFGQLKQRLQAAGFSEDRVFFDPGIGFGKDDSGNLAILEAVIKGGFGLPLCVGLSRKSFIGRLFKLPDPMQRDDLSKAFELCVSWADVGIIRTHEIGQLCDLRKISAQHE